MPVRLSLHLPEGPVRTVRLEAGRRYGLGRDEACDVVVEDARVSRRHAELLVREDGGVLTDLGSKNGLEVDGRRLAPQESVELAAPCWFTLGGLPVRFEVVSPEAERRAVEASVERWRTTLAHHGRLDPADGLPVLLERMLGSVLELSAAERGFVLLERADGELEVAAALGLEPERLGEEGFAGSVGAVRRVLATARPVVVSDALAEPDLAGRTSVATGGIRAMVCLPLLVLEHLLGVVYADSRRPGSRFTELDVEILEALASHAALALEVARLHNAIDGAREHLVGSREPSFAELTGTVAWSEVEAAHGEPSGAVW